MFRMKFQSIVDDYLTSSNDEEEDTRSTCRDETVSKVVLFEGTRVRKYEKISPLPSSDSTSSPLFADGQVVSSLRSMMLNSSAGPVSGPKLSKPDPDLFAAVPAQEPTDSTPQQARDGESRHGNCSLTEKTTVVTYLHYEDSVSRQDSKMAVSVETPARSALHSSNTTSETSDCERSTSTDRKEDEEGVESVGGMISEFLQEKDDLREQKKFGAPWEEPLLAVHEQEELDLMAKEEAKVEAQNLEAEEQLKRESELQELRALALCSTLSGLSLERSTAFTNSKTKGKWGTSMVTRFCRLLRRPFRIFRPQKRYPDEYYPDARAAKVVVPKASVFGGSWTDRPPRSEITDSHLATLRNAPQLGVRIRPPVIQFATVISTHRDVPAWTREEYIRRNGRIPHNSNYDKDEDEEFGGIEGNNLMNQYFDDGVTTDYDSDSD